jgi:L-seryl-tRNA(Ser) seleniumtransferase
VDKNQLFRQIPKVDVILENETIKDLINEFSYDVVMEAIHDETEKLRELIAKTSDKIETSAVILSEINSLVANIIEYVTRVYTPNMRKVINATGTILHTNLGRAVISKAHMEKAIDVVCGYSNLEYNLGEGRRGERYFHFEELVCKITGAEACMAVNNNASSVLLILSALANGGEVIVSRGELIEIGGKFRIPDVMELSGAKLVEVGTTNKTHLEDYTTAINEETKALLKVHTSNYSIVGFTENVKIEELTPVAREANIPIIEDLGSGVLVNLEEFGLAHEPTVQESIANGADVVCFSGDKLLGGPQAGIIIGKKKYIDMMKKNQLTRALRIDKFTAATLELVFMEYLSKDNAIKNIPVLHMISKPDEEVLDEAIELKEKLEKIFLNATSEQNIQITIEPCESQIGGGSLPLEKIQSYGVVIKSKKVSTAALEERLRKLEVPIIARIVDDCLLLDVRTINKEDMQILIQQLEKVGEL